MKTFIEILLDETGSMSSCHNQTISGFNSFIKEQQEIEGQCFVTLSKFDSSSILTPYENLSLEMVPPLMFNPRGGTNLYDVVGERVTSSIEKSSIGRILCVIITDGEDNSSRKYNSSSIAALVTIAKECGISFAYFGAGSNAKRVGLSMGLSDADITVFKTEHMADTMKTASARTKAFRIS